MAEKSVRVTLIKRPSTERLKVILKGMGLNKISSSRVLKDNPCTRGMIGKVSHLVSVKDAG
ncbi:MAG: 50S ribosomal protein L30 [Deltaproteobacteria bacterium]|nr:50S ribosomal protein L30 [Deltaproteobacteria bacterium]